MNQQQQQQQRIRSVSPHPHEANEQIRRIIWGGGTCKSGTTNEADQIQNKQVDNNSSQPEPKPKTTTRVNFQKGFLVGYSGGVDHVAIIEVLQHDVANTTKKKNKKKTFGILVPAPSETWFRGMSVEGSFRRA